MFFFEYFIYCFVLEKYSNFKHLDITHNLTKELQDN